MVIMATRIDIGPADTCYACLVPRAQTPRNEEWCFDMHNRPLCGQCARDEYIIHEPWAEDFPDAEFLPKPPADILHFPY
jgi:hypothetical protein